MAGDFLSAAFNSASNADGKPAELEPLLDAALARARQAHPAIMLPAEDFAAYLGARSSEGTRVADDLAQLHVADLYVACGCARHDRAALTVLDGSLRGEVHRAAARVTTPELADEALQVLREKLLVPKDGGRPRIEDYLGRGPLVGWLCAAAVRTALTLRRATGREVPSEQPMLELEFGADSADLRLMRERFSAEFAPAFREAVASLDARSRNALRMHVLDGLNIDQIGSVYGVHRSSVARWIARSRETLLAETRRRIGQRLGLGDSELDSLFRMVDGKLEVSLTSVLR